MKKIYCLLLVAILSMALMSCDKNSDNVHTCISCGYKYEFVHHDTVNCFNRQGLYDYGYTFGISTRFGIVKYKFKFKNNDAFLPIVGHSYNGDYWLKKYTCGYNEIVEIYLEDLLKENQEVSAHDIQDIQLAE